jgi:hypothetical protein
MTTILITCSLVVLLFGFDPDKLRKSNGSLRRARPDHKKNFANFVSFCLIRLKIFNKR